MRCNHTNNEDILISYFINNYVNMITICYIIIYFLFKLEDAAILIPIVNKLLHITKLTPKYLILDPKFCITTSFISNEILSHTLVYIRFVFVELNVIPYLFSYF